MKSKAEQKVDELLQEAKRLAKRIRSTTDKGLQKKLKSEQRTLHSRLQGARRQLHQQQVKEQERQNILVKYEQEKRLREQEERRLQAMVQADLQKREALKKLQKTTEFRETSFVKENVCPSCDTPYQYEFGFTRCRCT